MSLIPRKVATLASLPLLAFFVSLALALGAGPAAAQDKDKDTKAAAKEHFQRGTSFYDLGRYPEAIKEFEAAYQLKNDPAFLYNLAQSYRQAGDAEQALHFYRTYLRYVPKATNRSEIEERIAALEKQVAAKGSTGTQPPPPGGGTTPPPPVDTGAGTTTTTPPPPPPTGPTVTVTGTGTAPPGTPPPGYGTPATGINAPPPATSNSDQLDKARKLQIAGLVTAGAGGLMFLVGVVEGLRARSASNDVEASARNGIAYDPAVQQRGQSAEKAEAVFITLGVLAGAGGLALWYYGKRVAAQAETTTYKISLAPVIAPSGGGAWLRISF